MKKNAIFIFFVLCISLQPILAQTRNIDGLISDSMGPLPGATIVSLNKGSGTISDLDGTFSLVVSVQDTLHISYLGYIPQNIPLNGKDFIEVQLIEDVTQLEETVLIGYGRVKKSDVTGSISSIKAEDMMTTVVSSIDQGIQGKASGVVVNFGSGQPGSKSTIRIRGISSIMGTLEPLYVVDGIPLNTSSNVGAVTGPSMNPLESINPRDIASIEILKDASATAIYGTRGANGVILVTTKRGQEGKAVVSVDYSGSIQQLRNKIEMLNAEQLAELGNEAAINAGVDQRSIYASPVNLGIGTDWQDEIFRIAPMHNAQVAVRGGSKTTKYALSGSFLTQDGIILASSFEKANLRINLDQQISDRVKLGTSINLNKNVLNGVITDSESAIPSSVTSWALEFNPGLPVFNEAGNYVNSNNTSNPPVGNPVEDANRIDQLSKATRILGNLYLEWEFLKDIKFKTSIAGDFYFNKEQSFIPNDVYRGQEKGQAAIANSDGITWLLENTINFNKSFGDHSIDAVVGHSLQAFENEFLFVATSDFDDNRLGYNAIQVGSEKTLLFNGNSKRQLQSFLGRVNYNYKGKYLLTASARVDGSSVFGEGNKYGLFPSLAAAWNMHHEPFLKGSDLISETKIRLGLGRVGNEGLPPYRSLGLLETTEAYFGENEIAKGSGPASPKNSLLKWETTDQIDLGLDMGFFKNRLRLTTDVYFKKTKDLLLQALVPYTSGYKNAFQNIGNLENKGIELAINSVNVVTDNFNWDTNFNIALNRNKITNIARDEGIPAEPLLGINSWTSVEIDQPIGNFYGFETDGIIQSNEDPSQVPRFSDYIPQAGDRKYVDQDGNGILNEDDKVLLGNANPDFTFGMGNTFKYKQWSLSVFVQGIYGNTVANFNRFSLESFDGLRNNSITALDRWSTSNPTNDFPRANATPRRSNTLSDIQVEDGSYLKVRDITLAYNFNSELLSKLNLSNVKLFMSGKNLFVLTNYSGYDPEVNRFGEDPLRFGVDYGSYPTTRIFTAGINISF